MDCVARVQIVAFVQIDDAVLAKRRIPVRLPGSRTGRRIRIYGRCRCLGLIQVHAPVGAARGGMFLGVVQGDLA
ncbi:hypothetical protein LP420_40195 [Massilia sp. B-10]|nr:hypothetical protein LP420_40195 [Massilia sp. B-10]